MARAPTRAMSRWIFFKNKKNNKVKLSVNLKIFAFYGGSAERMGQQIFLQWVHFQRLKSSIVRVRREGRGGVAEKERWEDGVRKERKKWGKGSTVINTILSEIWKGVPGIEMKPDSSHDYPCIICAGDCKGRL